MAPGRGSFGLELRYALGLSNINSSSDADESAKNRHFEAAGTYRIPIRR